MLFVYGSLMSMRILEEIHFWKTQEKEHTEVIRALIPNLEPKYAKAMQEWEVIFEKTEMSSLQWIEWVSVTKRPTDPYLQQQLNEIIQVSVSQSKEFISLLLNMEHHSKAAQSSPLIKTVIEHIIRESEYFLGVIQGLQASGHYPYMPEGHAPYGVPAGSAPPAYPLRQPAAPQQQEPEKKEKEVRISSLSKDIDAPDRTEPMKSTGDSTWSDPLRAPKPVPIGGHKLPPLPYPYNALEPYIDEKTMRIHHTKHHQSYVNDLNKAEVMLAKERKSGNFDLVKHWERELAFNGAGHYLHTVFWNNMSPKGGGKPRGPIAAEIDRVFGGFEPFKKHFSAAAEKVEGGGWALLVWSPRSHRVEILQAEKHQNLSQWDVIPLLVLDVWEHSYYLKHQSERAKYIADWWHVVNWENVNERYEKASKLKWMPF